MRPIAMPGAEPRHAAPITHVAFHPDGTRLASSSYDGSTVVWQCGPGPRLVPRCRLKHRRLVNAAAWNPVRPRLLATASADKTVVVWEVPDGAGEPGAVAVLARHTDDVNSVAWLPDGERLVCVSEDGRASLWDGLRGRFLGSPVAHAAHCMMVATDRTGLVATVGEDGLVAVVDPDGGRPARRRRYGSSVEGCAWAHAAGLLAVCRDDGRLDLLDPDLAVVRSVPVAGSAARSAAWSGDDRTVVVGSYDGAVHFLDAARGERLGRVDDPRQWPRSVAAHGDLVAVGSFRSGPHLLSLPGRRTVLGPGPATHGPNALARHGRSLLVGCDSGAVLTVDLPSAATGRPEATVAVPTAGPVLSLAVTPDRAVAGTYAGQVLDAEDAAVGAGVGSPVPSLLAVGDAVVAGTYDGDLVELAAGTLAERRRVRPHQGSVKALAALDAGTFVSAATDRTVAAGTLTDRAVLWEHGNLVNAVATLGGTVVASASRDHTVRVGRLDRAGGRCRVTARQTLVGPDESVKCVGLLGTADAPLVLAGSYDFGLYAWAVDWAGGGGLRDGRLVAELGQGLSCIARVGRHTAAVAGWDGRVLLVGWPGGEPRVTAEIRVAELVAAAGAEDLR